MHKNATKCNETLNKWCKNKHGSSKIMDTLETYQWGSEAFKERVIKEGPWEEEGDASNICMKMVTCTRKVASKEFGVSMGSRREAKDIWCGMMMSRRVLRRKRIL
jgi:hypothetical protein